MSDIKLLEDILKEYKEGKLDMSIKARPCYISKQHKLQNKTSWIHNDELEGHTIINKIGSQQAKTR